MIHKRLWALAALALLVSCGRSGGRYPDFADLVERSSPSVVNISTISAAPPEEVAAQDDSPIDDFFRKYFSDRDAPAEGTAEDVPLPQAESLGSGFVLWSDGYIVTNRHVVRGAREVIVKLSDRRQMPAKVVGTDERSDLALLKIDATGLPAVKLGDVSKLRVGEWVLAIGSPFSFDFSVTAGIVSAKGRALPSENYVPFIQTDVAINPGNSGGPLFNTDGEVIGVNSQIFSQTGGYMGVSFAIPIDVAAKVCQQLKDHGKVSRGWLGVVVQEVTRDLAQTFGLERPEGALISRVVAGGPGAQAGLKAGDVILEYDGRELPLSSALPPLVGNTDPGATVSMKVLREKKRVEIKVVVGTLEAEEAGVPKSEPPPRASAGAEGIVVRGLSKEERARAQIVSGGALVLEVHDGAGRDAGLLPGDILLTIGGSEIDGPERLAEVIARLTPGESAPMLVQRRGQPTFLALEIPRRDRGPDGRAPERE